MSRRLSDGGRLIDRNKPIRFTFDGKRLSGFQGDTLASALLANGETVVGRSFKFHRPRGIVASGPEEPNALVGLGQGPRREPNQVATMSELFDGLVAESQNRWPSLKFDAGALSDRFSRFLPAGFYYKTFISPRIAWRVLFEPAIRRMAGLGKPPELPDPDQYEHFHAHVDILVVGGGIAGLAAARLAAASGARVLVLEQKPVWGGRSAADGVTIGGAPATEWVRSTVNELEASGAALRLRTTALGAYSHGYVLACERLADHKPGESGARQRLWRIRASKVIVAAGAIERPLVCPGNDLPGVMLASAVRDYLSEFGVSAGDRIAIVANNDDAYRTGLALADSGVDVPAILDTRPSAAGELQALAREKGIRVLESSGVAEILGARRVRGIAVCPIDGRGAKSERISCDAVALSGGWSPAVHLWSHAGGKLLWDERSVLFRPDTNRPPPGDDGKAMAYSAGAANGVLLCRDIASDAEKAATAALQDLGIEPARMECPRVESGVGGEAATESAWLVPGSMTRADRSRAWLDFQNDVKVSDIDLAALEGYESVEHAKRYTTLGMATDQGKLSNVNGLAVLAADLGAEIPEVGTTTFRPPYVPVAMGAIAGEAAGELFKPVRKTPMHDWHERNGANWEPVGDWRRPYCYLRAGEGVKDAVNREVLRTRRGAGLLDASTLGKLLVAGPDAGRFMDMLYTSVMSSLPVGRCKYGLMCNENGFLMDDGVVARIDDTTFLCHTTTGGADRIHAWMEEWLQTEWWDWRAHVYNLTEQYAQIGVAGPSARSLLEKLGGMDLSAESFPFMHWRDGNIGKFKVRAYRISFSGELSFELAVRAGDGLELWTALIEAGEEFGAVAYGTECLHVMRAEKGFIMIGDETDGTVTPRDLGLNWAISKTKGDFIGKRALERPYLTRSDRWRLVGLELPRFKSKDALEDGIYLFEKGAVNAHGHTKMIGRVTSTYYSPTLERPIALALVESGPERLGEIVCVNSKDRGKDIAAKIVKPVFLDEEGRRQNA
ncbi:MAG: sarcosine oxidase subunit alpha family protein [Albidovulum sp.]|nr:sarcosine oxidase subunit alpha family protein [Albidovulum sp.]